MNVTLTSRAEALINERIERGEYASADAVIEEALMALRERENARFAETGTKFRTDDPEDQFNASETDLDELRAMIQIGIDEADRGELDEWTPALRARIRQSANERFARGEQPDADVVP